MTSITYVFVLYMLFPTRINPYPSSSLHAFSALQDYVSGLDMMKSKTCKYILFKEKLSQKSN